MGFWHKNWKPWQMKTNQKIHIGLKEKEMKTIKQKHMISNQNEWKLTKTSFLCKQNRWKTNGFCRFWMKAIHKKTKVSTNRFAFLLIIFSCTMPLTCSKASPVGTHAERSTHGPWKAQRHLHSWWMVCSWSTKWWFPSVLSHVAYLISNIYISAFT